MSALAVAGPAVRFDHLRALTGPLGVWEHALLRTPRQEHGYCTDDNARALIVVSQAAAADELVPLAERYLAFVLDARTGGGFHNRRSADGAWLDVVGPDDANGRAWWALGVVARDGATASLRAAGRRALEQCDGFASPHLRSNAYAVLGGAAALATAPDDAAARRLVARCVAPLAMAVASGSPWPEARLTYDNARIPEALLAAGVALDDAGLRDTGLALLRWLVGVETSGDHVSPTPVGGWAPGEPRPGFDQQPIEALALAEACHRAWVATGSETWRVEALRAARWFTGDNDLGLVLHDAATGGTADGLHADRSNANQGAESTLAGLGAARIAAACAAPVPTAPA